LVLENIIANPKSRAIFEGSRPSDLQIDSIERVERLKFESSDRVPESHVPLGHGFHALIHLLTPAEARAFVHTDELEEGDPFVRRAE
jgi:hypothetical protein